MSDRPVPQPRPAVRPATQPAPAPALKSALGRPAETPAQVYTWNGSPSRISEGPGTQPHSPYAAPQSPSYSHSTGPTVQPTGPHQQVTAAPHQPPLATPSSAPVHLPRGSILVQPGDTLYGLSRRHGVSISALMDTNKLKSLTLVPGQVLKLPASVRARG